MSPRRAPTRAHRPQYTCVIEDDPRTPGASMIVFYDPGGNICGVPARGLTGKQAFEMLKPCRFAFEYGVEAARLTLVRAVDGNLLKVE